MKRWAELGRGKIYSKLGDSALHNWGQRVQEGKARAKANLSYRERLSVLSIVYKTHYGQSRNQQEQNISLISTHIP